MKSNTIGTIVAIIAQSFSALGMNLQRYAHTLHTDKPLIWRWPFLLGLVCLGLTEVSNFVALSFSPVSTIAPLGSFSIIMSAIFGQLFFSEKVKFNGAVGIVLIAFGTFLTISNGPSSSKDFTVEEFMELLKNPKKTSYFACIIIIMIILYIIGNKNLFLIVALASISAGNSVTLSKALAVFVKISITSQNQLTSFLPYCIIAFMVGSIILQVNRLNKAMENHKAYIVNSLYFVMLTVMSILNSSILYGEMISLNMNGKISFFFGLVLMGSGVFLLSSRSVKITTIPDEEIPFINNNLNQTMDNSKESLKDV